MKKSCLLLIAAISVSLTQAQSINFGAKAGLNLANVTGSDASGNSILVSFHAGGLAQISLTDQFSVQPEVMYSGQGAKFSQSGESGTDKLGYINVPVLAKFTTSSGFFVQTGPQIGFLLSAKESSGGTSMDIKSDVTSTDFSWVFGLGYLTSANVGIDGRYVLGFTNLEKNTGGNSNGTLKNGVIQIGLFYLFGDSKEKK
jgi:hypothetical protein